MSRIEVVKCDSCESRLDNEPRKPGSKVIESFYRGPFGLGGKEYVLLYVGSNNYAYYLTGQYRVMM